MASHSEHYVATIPSLVILRENPVAIVVIGFLMSHGIGRMDGDGYHFKVQTGVDGWYTIEEAPQDLEVHGDDDSALDRLIDDWQVQLVHSWTYDSGAWFGPEEQERGLRAAFYEGLFASRV